MVCYSVVAIEHVCSTLSPYVLLLLVVTTIIGFEQTAYSVTEGDVVMVCVRVLYGTLTEETVVTLSTMDDSAKGQWKLCINHACAIV